MNDNMLTEPGVCDVCGEDEGDPHDPVIHALDVLSPWELFSIWFVNWRTRPVWKWWR
jgi:hypothetical protein